MKKKCFKCKRIKPIDQFYAHRAMGDGPLGKCKSCTKKDVSTRYEDPKARARIRAYERARFRDRARKANLLLYARRMRQRSRGKARARRLIPLTQVRLYVVSSPRRSDWSAFVDFLD